MRVGVLGRPALYGDDGPVALSGAREAGLLAVLVANLGRTVRAEQLEDELWDGRRISDATLRVAVNRLRRRADEITGRDLIASEPGGYRLLVDPLEVDAVAWDDLLEVARRARAGGDAERALAALEAAGTMVRGEPYDGFSHLPSVRPEHDRLLELRWSSLEHRAAAMLELGDPAGCLATLDQLLAREPLREPAWGLRMVGLARAGRTSDALRAAATIRSLLDEEFRVAPSAELQALEQAILDGRPIEDVEVGLLAHRMERASATPVSNRAADVAMVGRTRELAALRAAVDRSVDDGLQVVVVRGEPGIGKTTLVEAFISEHRGRGHGALLGRCDRTGSIPLHAPLEALDRYVGVAGGPSGLELARLFARAADPDARRGEDLELQRHRVLRLLGDVTAAAAAPGRLVVCLDDAHWIDPMSVALVEHLLVGQVGVPAVLVVTTRLEDGPLDQLLAEAGGTGRVTWLPLERLDARSMTTLLREAVDDEAADRVHRASGGNPLYALQVAKLVDDPDWASGPLPEDLDRLCRARLDTLPRDVAQLVRAAAVLGDEFDGVALAHLLDESRVAISARLGLAVLAGLVNPDSGADRFRFAHGIMRQAADGQLDPSTRAHLHAAAARHLGGDPLGHRGEIAHHLFEARRLVAGEEVAAALVLAGSEALALGDADAARRCYLLVSEVVELDSPHRAAASLGLGLASAAAGQLLESTSYLDDTLDAARRLGRWDLVADAIIARTQFGLAASIPAAIEEVRVIDEVLEHLDAVERERRCLLLCWTFDLLANTSATVAAAALDEAAQLAADLDDPRLERLVAFGRLRQSDAACEAPADRLDDAAALVTRAEEAGDAALAGRAGLLLQGFRLRSGEVDAAVADHERLRALASDPGTALQYDIAEVGLATATEPIEAIDRASSKALDHLLSDSASLPTVVRMIHLMAIRREQRRLGELEPFLVMALAVGPRRVTRPLVAASRLEAGDRRGADEEHRTFVGELEAMEVDWAFLATLAFAAESAAEGGYTPLASPLKERLAASPPQVVVACSVLLSLGHVDRYLGLALALQGDLDQAIARFASARGHDRASGAALWAAWAAHGEAEARLRRAAAGDERTALALLVSAEQTARTHESPRLLHAVARVRPTAP